MSKFKIGEKVAFLYEKGQGKILAFSSNNQVKVEDENGFDNLYPESELVKIHSFDYDESIPVMKGEEVKMEKSDFTIIEEKSNARDKNYWELDLHIEHLMENFRGLSNFEIMKTQMSEFKRFYSKAKSNFIEKIVVIHGVGEGVLKNEIRNYLAQQEFIEFYDASYLEYGKGATEIRFLNLKNK